MKSDRPTTTPGRLILVATRTWLPLAIAVAGVVLIVLGHASLSAQSNTRTVEAATGVALLIVAVMVWMLNWMYRLSIASNRDRERDEEAREYFDRNGRWPDEDPE